MPETSPDDGSIESASLLRQLKRLSLETRELDGTSIDQVHISELSPAAFLRDFVGPNKPCLIKGALDHWPAVRKWDAAYFRSLQDLHVTIDLTPNGFGDAVTPLPPADADTSQPVSSSGGGSGDGGSVGSCFATPHEQRMTLAAFLDLLQDPSCPSVAYLQHQNSNLTEELGVLLADVDPSPSWADEAFGALPDAVNLWIGNARSTTSFHKDHYENLYAVVRGTKIFTLLPPCDVFRMHLGRYPAACFQPDATGNLAPQPLQPPSEVIWCPVNPYPSGADTRQAAELAWPLYFDRQLPAPLRVEVSEGDLLYLPAMWYHYVQQREDASGLVVAVNYWYDMKYDMKYALHKFVEGLASRIGLVPQPPGVRGGSNGDEDVCDEDAL